MVVINTNGVDVANPAIMAKYDKGRVQGTLVYPNALAGAVLLLWPLAIVSVFAVTRNLRPLTRYAAIALVLALGAAGLFFSGSKGGWLIALGVGVFWLCRLNWPRRLKWLTVTFLIIAGLIVFAFRFQAYFAKGATSVGARFDYWRVAAEVAIKHPVLGSGPGTFQRPYADLKKPESEMARLVHNDYLEQFSDSGFIGGLSYLAWIGLTLSVLGKRIWRTPGWLEFSLFAGLLGWFVQGFMEFSLYVPALAWTAFTFAGCLLVHSANQFDKPPPAV
jgi:O-antigen ligase